MNKATCSVPGAGQTWCINYPPTPRKGRPCNITDGETEVQRGQLSGSGQTATEAGASPGLWGPGCCTMLQSDPQKEEVSQEGERSGGSSLSQNRMAHPTLD